MNLMKEQKEIEKKIKDIFNNIDLSEVLELAKDKNHGVLHRTIERTIGRIVKKITTEAREHNISECNEHLFAEWNWSLRKNLFNNYFYHYRRTCKHCYHEENFNVDDQTDAPKGTENAKKEFYNLNIG